MSAAWHVATIRPGQGDQVYRRLGERGFELWRPMHDCWRQKRGSRKREVVSRPCLPAYLFIALTPRIWDAQRLFGVTGMLRAGSELAVVPDADLDPLRQLVDSHGADEAVQVCRLAHGAMLQIIDGPLAGMSGKLAGTDNRNSVEIASNSWPGTVHASIDNVRVLP